MPRYVWGVDSAATVTEDLYQCVRRNFGMPRFWGRYLTTVPNASEGLTKEEISFIRNKGIKVLPIYNAFREATGYSKGRVAATNAVFHARRLGFPKGTVLFANVERFFAVDKDWIQGWVEALYPSGYKPGFYHVPTEGNFNVAFCQAAKENEKVRIQSFLWSAEPNVGGSPPNEAPPYKPETPNCKGNVWLWQYGRDTQQCPIDTNLADERVLASLW
jgi:Domain of unknown function (DUF1906)